MVHGEVKRGTSDHFRLEGGTVRVLGGTTLDGSGEDTLRIHRLSIEFHVEKSKEKEVIDSEKMKTTIEEEGKEGDESPQIEDFDEEKENEETKKKMKKEKEVFHEWEHLNMYKVLWSCRCRQWRFLSFRSSPESEDILSGNRDRYTQCKLCCWGP